MDWFCELNQRQRFSWKQVRLRDSDGIELLVLVEAIHKIIKLQTMLLLKEWHEVFYNLDKDRLLLF